jgi:hypothetical protein
LNDKLYHDTTPKEIGDRVNVLDFSSCTHLNGNELDYEQNEELDFYFIVIETKQKVIFNAYFNEYLQNLVIVNHITNKQYRINSGHVKLMK